MTGNILCCINWGGGAQHSVTIHVLKGNGLDGHCIDQRLTREQISDKNHPLDEKEDSYIGGTVILRTRRLNCKYVTVGS